MSDDKSDALKVVEDAWTRSYAVQNPRNTIYERLWQRYKCYNPNIGDPYQSNIIFPKLYTIVETIAPRLGKALFGRRPYIPIKSERNPDGAEPIEDALDAYLYMQKFKIHGTQALKGIALFGTWFLEPYPDVEMVTVRQNIISPVYPWQPITIEREVPRFRLRVRRWAPWQVYVEPYMLGINDPGWAITVEIIAKKEIKKLMGQRYDEIDLDRLSDPSLAESEKNFARNMMSSIGIALPSHDTEYGILTRYMSRDRYITIWNGIDILEDRDNPFKHKRINLVRIVCNQDPMLQNSFWGQSEGKAIEPILDKLDETWNVTFNEHDRLNHGVLAFHPSAIQNPDNLTWIGGARIQFNPTWPTNVPLRNGVDLLESRGLPADHYQIPTVLDREADRASGVYAQNRGEHDEDAKTATETSILASQGDLRNELRADIIETLGLSDFADKATSHIDQFASFDDLFEVIGEKALMAQTMNPNMLDGGFDYQFKGSDTIVNDLQKQALWDKIMSNHANDPSWRPGEALRESMRIAGKSEQEIDRLVFTQEEIMMMAQQQAMMQQQMEIDREGRALEGDVARAQLGIGRGGGSNQKKLPARVPTAGNM